MSDSLERRELARAAARLAAHGRFVTPPLVLMTDDERLPDPLAAARTLPSGSMIVVRARDDARRKVLAHAMVDLARARGLVVLVAGDATLAAACGADGLHLPEARLGEATHWRARHPRFLITAAAHSLAALRKTKHVDAIFLSPVFPTQSHPDRAALSAVRANLIARFARVPVYALGGIDATNAVLLSAKSFCGIAAIGGLSA